MFLDVKLGDVGIELPKEQVFDAIDWDRRALGRWLEKLYKHWAEKHEKGAVERTRSHCALQRSERRV